MRSPRLSALVVLLALVLPAAAFARPIDLPPTPIPPAPAQAAALPQPAAHPYSCSPNKTPTGSVQ